MLMLLLAFAFQFINKGSGFNEQCVYTDPISGLTFYLDSLAHDTLIYTADEIDKHTYTFTPCRNAAGECPNSEGSNHMNTGQCIQTLNTDPSVCTVISAFDAAVSPSYNSEGNGTWEFPYQNGDDAGCGNPRSFNAFFVCDMTAGDYAIHSAGELGPSCTYEFNIRTKWACPGENYTTTSIPIDDCKWYADNDENVLDLSTFDNGTIVAQSNSNDNLYYRYSPCRNELKCNDTMNMMDMYNVVTLNCKQYLAIWENAQYHSVGYNSVDKSWEFIYTNGQKCNGFESVMTIIWICNPSVESYRIVKADTTAPCQNVLEIESKVACS